ncbi:hypothetical protein TIFTF001_042727 [Ficus carica]|uniref:Uncharacterized protein n=1 Tax=Ficus carica TaxID=3494 RepID=A0AA87ZT30_FICCA|nr:hypothetical protein TIFTF001_042727 [Ficus carica]
MGNLFSLLRLFCFLILLFNPSIAVRTGPAVLPPPTKGQSRGREDQQQPQKPPAPIGRPNISP